jgi:hypothetical protein
VKCHIFLSPCSAFCFTTLYCTLLYSTLLSSTLLYCTLLYSTLQYSTLLYDTLLCSSWNQLRRRWSFQAASRTNCCSRSPGHRASRRHKLFHKNMQTVESQRRPTVCATTGGTHSCTINTSTTHHKQIVDPRRQQQKTTKTSTAVPTTAAATATATTTSIKTQS